MLGRSLWRSFFLLMLSGILLCLSVYCSLAWFSSNHVSEGFGFGAGTLPSNDLHIALIRRSEEEAPPTEGQREYFACEGNRFNTDHYPTKSGDNYTVELSDLSLGIIDNVARVKPENKIFLRLTVPKESGDTVAVKLYYGAYENGRFAELYKNIYDVDGKTVLYQTQVKEDELLPSTEEPILESFHAVEDEKSCYLSFSVLVSNDLIPAGELADTVFYGSNGEPAMNGNGSFYRVNAFDAESDGIVLRNEQIDTAGDYYYVYVRIEPDLAVFGRSIEYISGIMPCYLFFKLNAAFVVYPGQEV